jgi:hypothetical protein
VLVRWVVVLSCLAGCDVLLRLDHVDPPVSDAPPADTPLIDAKVDAPPTDGLLACPASYTLTVSGSTSRYRRGGIDAPWPSAESLCEMDGVGIMRRTHLAVIEDDTERTRLFTTLGTNGLKNFWIGLTDRKTEGTMKWVTAEPIGVPQDGLDPPWAAGQPDNNSTQTGGQDCVRMIAPLSTEEGHFDDVECIANFEFVCECDDYPAVPANF